MFGQRESSPPIGPFRPVTDRVPAASIGAITGRPVCCALEPSAVPGGFADLTEVLETASLAHLVVLSIHDASRIAWDIVLPLLPDRDLRYALELELEIPADIFVAHDPWARLQSRARLDIQRAAALDQGDSIDSLRRSIVGICAKLAWARDGFARHCTLLRGAESTPGEQLQPLRLWIAVAERVVSGAREGAVLQDPVDPSAEARERSLGDEYLSAQLWVALTDCARALEETRAGYEGLSSEMEEAFAGIEAALADALATEIDYRLEHGFACASPRSTRELERMLLRTRALKKHFHRVLFLEAEAYQVSNRLNGWFSAFAAVLAYLWFFFWQLALDRERDSFPAIGSGVLLVALITAVVYASREKLKEVGRNWIAGRVQRLFAQRVARYRLQGTAPGMGSPVVTAREFFSQSTALRPEPLDAGIGGGVGVTVVRFVHRGLLRRVPLHNVRASHVRHVFRYDLSPLFPRLHDAVKGLAVPDRATHRVVIAEVPRNYQLPVRVTLRTDGGQVEQRGTIILNKNGLLRVECSEQGRLPGADMTSATGGLPPTAPEDALWPHPRGQGEPVRRTAR